MKESIYIFAAALNIYPSFATDYAKASSVKESFGGQSLTPLLL